MFQRPRWGMQNGRGNFPQSGRGNFPQNGRGNFHQNGRGNFRPTSPQHMQRFPGPDQQNNFGTPPRGPPRPGGFIAREPGPQMFHGSPNHHMDQFPPRNMRPPIPSPDNGVRFQRPPFNGPPQGHNFRHRPPFNNNQNRQQFRPNAPSQGFNNTKKPKVDKRDLAENNQFYCDICDRGYKVEEKYQEHINSHQQCSYEGCSYVAAPKLVQLHISLQHRSGLAKKIWSLESPEDIKKWREERKKNYPTVENLEKKRAVMADKIARGEVIEEKYFGKMRGRGRGRFDRGRGRGTGRGQDRGQGEGRSRSNQESNQECKRMSDNKNNTGMSPAKKPKLEGSMDKADGINAKGIDPDKDPLGYFYNAIGSDFDSDSESEGESSRNPKPVKEPSGEVTEITAAGALGSLISSYGGSGDESDEGTVNDDASKSSQKNIQTESKQTEKPKRRNRNRRNKNERNKPQHPQKDNKSLLEKLLAKEIRKERNQILQCVYHIVQNNFFEDPDKKGGTADNNINDTVVTKSDEFKQVSSVNRR